MAQSIWICNRKQVHFQNPRCIQGPRSIEMLPKYQIAVPKVQLWLEGAATCFLHSFRIYRWKNWNNNLPHLILNFIRKNQRISNGVIEELFRKWHPTTRKSDCDELECGWTHQRCMLLQSGGYETMGSTFVAATNRKGSTLYFRRSYTWRFFGTTNGAFLVGRAAARKASSA